VSRRAGAQREVLPAEAGCRSQEQGQGGCDPSEGEEQARQRGVPGGPESCVEGRRADDEQHAAGGPSFRIQQPACNQEGTGGFQPEPSARFAQDGVGIPSRQRGGGVAAGEQIMVGVSVEDPNGGDLPVIGLQPKQEPVEAPGFAEEQAVGGGTGKGGLDLVGGDVDTGHDDAHH
jgi:hypothetical protein